MGCVTRDGAQAFPDGERSLARGAVPDLWRRKLLLSEDVLPGAKGANHFLRRSDPMRSELSFLLLVAVIPGAHAAPSLQCGLRNGNGLWVDLEKRISLTADRPRPIHFHAVTSLEVTPDRVKAEFSRHELRDYYAAEPIQMLMEVPRSLDLARQPDGSFVGSAAGITGQVECGLVDVGVVFYWPTLYESKAETSSAPIGELVAESEEDVILETARGETVIPKGTPGRVIDREATPVRDFTEWELLRYWATWDESCASRECAVQIAELRFTKHFEDSSFDWWEERHSAYFYLIEELPAGVRAAYVRDGERRIALEAMIVRYGIEEVEVPAYIEDSPAEPCIRSEQAINGLLDLNECAQRRMATFKVVRSRSR
jgi:hypothetical protein